MSTHSNAMPEAAVGTQAAAMSPLSPIHSFYWSVRRELWEYRSIYVAPTIVAGLVLLGFIVSLSLPRHLTAVSGIHKTHESGDPLQAYDFAGLMFMLTQMLVAAFYCLDCLYGERRDRSILFWKSMPVSDLTAVLAKAAIPFVIIPMLMGAFIVATQAIMFAVHSLVWVATGQSLASLYAQVPLFSLWVLNFYHLLAVHTYWYAPFYAWLMLASAFAPRAPLLWATLPPLVVGGLERIIFGTTHFGHLLLYRFAGGGEDSIPPAGGMPIDPMTHLTPVRFLITPSLWTGLILSVILLAIAVRLRRSRAPI
ncbi:MAG TPA: hypothetical protein VKV39_11960 [Candidatus Sulfotelmatobacter sp.]|nr:hypothetical protein [Candidatus Sulfotelmatobacter sp.]